MKDYGVNTLKVGLLLAVMTAIFVGMGALIGGEIGMLIAFAIAVGMNIFSSGIRTSSSCVCMAPRKSMPVPRPDYYRMVEDLGPARRAADAQGLHHA